MVRSGVVRRGRLRAGSLTSTVVAAPRREGVDALVLNGAKKLDYWWTVVFTDPLALPLVRLLTRTRWLDPTQVSVACIVLAALVGPAFATGTRAGFIAGALLFYTAFLLDCVDGKLARATGTTSDRGAGLDVVGDAVRRASATAGLIVGVWRYDGLADGAVWWAVAYAVCAYLFVELSGGSEVRRAAWFRAPDDSAGSTERSRWARALARYRLLPNPGMPDVQATAFIIGPLTGLIVPALGVALAVLAAGILMNARRLVA